VSAQAAAKRRGSQFELDALRHIRSLGFPAERLRLAGKDDEGDLAVDDAGFTYVLEAKAEKRMALAEYVKEAQIEAANYAKARGKDPSTVWGLALIKRPGRPIGESYVVTTLDDLLS